MVTRILCVPTLVASFTDESDPNAPELKEIPNGSLGYISDEGLLSMYGPPKKVKHVGHVTLSLIHI